MKLRYLLPALLLATAPCQALSIDPDAPVPTLTAKQKKILQKTAEEIARILKKSDGICDHATADAFAATVKTTVPELQLRLQEADLSEYELNQTLQPYGYMATDLLNKESELAGQYFYGSVALAQVFGAPAEATEQPAPAPAEVLEYLEELLEENEGSLPASFEDGGPGFTQDTAWEADLTYSRSSHPGMAVRVIPGATLKPQIRREYEQDGDYYDVFRFDFKHKGKLYTADMWVNITEYVEAREEQLPFSQEELAEAKKQIADLAKSLYPLVKSVHDKESADAAADAMEPLYALSMEFDQKGISMYIPEETIEATLQQEGLSSDFFEQKAREWESADYYGSEKLREILNR